ncbi:MAG: alpha/beta hydrolase [bacterium]
MGNELYFITNRNLVEENGKVISFGKQFNSVSPVNLRLGKVIRTKKGKKIELYEDIPTTESVNYDTDQQRKAGTIRLFHQLFKEMKSAEQVNKDTLVFIHGFNVSFDAAVESTFKFQEKLVSDRTNNVGRVILFSWPSDGEIHKYYSDRGDAANSGLAFARGFLKMRDFFVDFVHTLVPSEQCGGKIHLLCHSMGNYVLQCALQHLKTIDLLNQGVIHLFSQIIMVAADVDSDCFEYPGKLQDLPKICERITVYFNPQDMALKISKMKHNRDRLGAYGPDHPLQIPNRVILVDTTLRVHGMLEHSYYDDQGIFRDIVQTLNLVNVNAHSIEGRVYQQSNNTFVLS